MNKTVGSPDIIAVLKENGPMTSLKVWEILHREDPRFSYTAAKRYLQRLKCEDKVQLHYNVEKKEYIWEVKENDLRVRRMS